MKKMRYKGRPCLASLALPADRLKMFNDHIPLARAAAWKWSKRVRGHYDLAYTRALYSLLASARQFSPDSGRRKFSGFALASMEVNFLAFARDVRLATHGRCTRRPGIPQRVAFDERAVDVNRRTPTPFEIVSANDLADVIRSRLESDALRSAWDEIVIGGSYPALAAQELGGTRDGWRRRLCRIRTIAREVLSECV